jgi:hypothetical protein
LKWVEKLDLGDEHQFVIAELIDAWRQETKRIKRFAQELSTQATNDPLEKIELPMWLFVVGIPVVGALTVYMGHVWFGIHYWLGLIAIPLVFVFTLIAVTSTGLTAITPGGALGKLTQITYGVLAPGNVTTN